MDYKEPNLQEMHKNLIIADAKYSALLSICDNLRSENEHLRHIIEILITNQTSQI